MKKLLLLALTLTFGVLLPRAQAVDSLPFLSSIRAEAVEQLTIASNNVAATNNVAVNKKLIKTLQGALKSIDKTKTNYAAGAKTLSVLNKSFGRTPLTNDFNPLIEGTVDVYVTALAGIYDALEERVDASYPGKAQTAARKALAKFFAGIDGAYTNANIVLALKALAAATKAEAGAIKAVVKAEAAPAPPNGFSATITATGEGTFAYKPILQSVQGVYDSVLDRMSITSQEIKITGGISNLRTQSRNINFVLGGIPGSGTYTYNLTDAGLLALYGTSVTRTTGGFQNPQTTIEFAETYNVGDVDGGDVNQGTLTITFDTATKLAYGSFSFTVSGDDVSSRTATVNGSFSIITLP